MGRFVLNRPKRSEEGNLGKWQDTIAKMKIKSASITTLIATPWL
jgi:hypothetical protein